MSFSVVNSGNLSEKTATDWSDVDTPLNAVSARGSDSDSGSGHRVTAASDSVAVGQTSTAVETQLRDAAEALLDTAATGYELSANTLHADDCIALESETQVYTCVYCYRCYCSITIACSSLSKLSSLLKNVTLLGGLV